MRSLKNFQKVIGYSFKDESYLYLALTHSSYANEFHEARGNNERLEFLGDAVLELVSSEFLYQKYNNLKEGDMSKRRAAMVCEPSLAFCARKISLPEYLMLGKGEESGGGRDRDSIISDALEAVIGAIYLDGGFTNAKEFVLNHVLSETKDSEFFYDSKTILQEQVVVTYGVEPVYEVVSEHGPDHAKVFEVAVKWNEKVWGVGSGKSKKHAQQAAAAMALKKLKEEE